MRIAVLTSLYPSAVRPHEGVFAERRWLGMGARGHAVGIVHPLPWSPLSFARREWSELARMASVEERGGLRIDRPRYVHMPGRALANARAFAARGLRCILARGKPEVVVADYAWPASAAAPKLEPTDIACVISGRGSDVLQVAGEAGLGPELARNLRSAGHWCAVSADLVARMDQLAGSPGRGVLVPNGVDADLFHPRERDAARKELQIEPKPTLVLVVGHLIERKDPLLALAAFEALPSELRSRSRLVFIGRGPLETALRAEIARRAAGQRVTLAGEVAPSALATWYAAADLLLLCSHREGRPNVVLEALSCGTPVLATDAGGTAELLGEFDGMLARTRDPAQLAALAARLLERPRDARRLSEHVRQFSWDKSFEALEGVLESALRAKRGARA
jgi:glycosyltransferase involved in cell wall biosynthesis